MPRLQSLKLILAKLRSIVRLFMDNGMRTLRSVSTGLSISKNPFLMMLNNGVKPEGAVHKNKKRNEV